MALLLAIGLAVTASCSSGELPAISGQVLVDGAPLDSGTLRLEPVQGARTKGAGGEVKEGVLRLPAGHGLLPGKYRASAVAFKKTGKTINDYQRGPIEETVQLMLQDSPHEIEISRDSARNLTIEFTTVAKK